MAEPLFETPIVLFVFNRPEVTRRNLEVLRALRPATLLVVADGPRASRPAEAALCEEVRAMVLAEEWPGTVETRFAERNLGLEANIELGLDWAFAQVDRAIVLEDDCIPHPSFFRYCSELLEKYADEQQVWQIGGDTKGVPEAMFGGTSYAFSTWSSVWGWATWADRWHRHRASFPRDHAGAEAREGQIPRTADAWRVAPVVPAEGSLVTEAAMKHFTQVAGEPDGDARGWDHHWWVTIMSQGGLSTMPARNLVENDGYGEDATHTTAAKDPYPAEGLTFPLVHPPLELNRDVEGELELVLLRTDGRLSRFMRKLIRPLWMRAIVRRIVTTPIVWRLVRKVVAK